MKLILVASFLAAVGPQAANADAADVALPPSCGLECIETLTVQPPCSPVDTACVCTNRELNQEITHCVLEKCSITDQLATTKYSMDTCGVEPYDDTQTVVVVPMVFGAIAFLVFGVRVVEKTHFHAGTWSWDDTAMALSVIFWLPIMFLSIPLAHHGLGRDIWANSPHDITQILYLYFWDELVYFPQVALTKISILLFYLRIFERSSARLRPAIVDLIIANVLYAMIFSLVSLFQCTPVPGAWLAWTGEYTTTCRNINAQGWAGAAFNIAFDIATILVPMRELSKLSLSTRKKVQLLLMFGIGFFVTIVSVIRLHALVAFGNSENFTKDFATLGIWTTVECPVGIICACLPATRSLLTRYFPKLLGKTTGSGRSKTAGAYSSNSYVKSRGDETEAPTHKDRVQWKDAPSIQLRDLDQNSSHHDLSSYEPAAARDIG